LLIPVVAPTSKNKIAAAKNGGIPATFWRSKLSRKKNRENAKKYSAM
jgi:hypothetical protein